MSDSNQEPHFGHRYDGHGGNSPQWWPHRYGPDDQVGSGNELTPERTLRALKLPKEGRCLPLAQLLFEGAPAFPPRDWRQLILAHGALEGRLMGDEGQLSYFEEHINATYQIGCHLDGLGHVGINGRFYNGTHYEEMYDPKGLKKLGIENVRPWVTRGVCLNIAAVEGTQRLEEGFVITPDHLERAQEAQGIEIEPGDVVLLHTGWGELWDKDIHRYEAMGEPGCGWDGAHYLTDRRVSLVGADNWAFEVLPGERENAPFQVHQHLLAETGTHILENITTTPLVEGGHSEFLFVLTVQRSQGSTGAMAGPVAVV